MDDLRGSPMDVGSLKEIIDNDYAIAMSVVGVLQDDTYPMVSVMTFEKAHTKSHADIGVLEQQIQGIKETVELLLTHPELYEEMGTKPPKGEKLLAKVMANQTSATFLCVMEHAPSIVFIDEIHAIGTKRYDSNSGGEREIQRTMLELLNQLDGFDSRDVKIEFSLPDVKTKRLIFNIHTERMTLSDDVDLEEFVMFKDDLS
ncbi:8407_t:CDS:2, partial [Cetraspora pellucida]